MKTTQEMKRITVSLDSETSRMVEELVDKDNKTISEIIRSAISSYYKLEGNKKLKPEVIEIVSELLSEREHVIVDIGLWAAILEELNEKAKEDFWKVVEEIGWEHGIQLKSMGLKRIHDVLKYLESENWFRVKIISKNTYILVLTAKAEDKILSVFLQGVFKAVELPVDILEGNRKLIIVDKMLDSQSELLRKYLD
ncbi:CopG family transcriptional regulator [Archaeoglobales archaeon]|nr:MAG: CopG family transcriptional regulator [Archaeoglobales archaeon]